MAAARELFVENGFAATGTPEIVLSAGVTRGALYHHFGDKTDLFRAVVRAEAEAVARHVSVAGPHHALPEDALRYGMRAYFEAMTVAGRTRLLLVDGLAVLGPAEMRAIDRATGGAELREGLQKAMKCSDIVLVEPLADLLSAMADRASLAISCGEDRTFYEAAVDQVLDRLVG
jgi:AcrR family transcriptional regulator